jgi:hypothetical protein
LNKKIQTLIDELSPALIADGSPRLKTGQTVDLSTIREIETQLGLIIPDDYKDFLQTYGWLGIGDVFVFGIWKDRPNATGGATILGETLRLRQNSNLPHYLLPFFGSEYSSYICINSSPVETAHKLVFFDSETGQVDECTHAKSFGDFLEGFLSDWLQSIKGTGVP